jgi:cell division protein FtsN
MVRWRYVNGALLSCVASLAVAQSPARATDPVFVRAQGLVSDGNGAAGRALIDSVIKATSPTARLYPEALFWRASLASNAADAESDYKHIVVDYPLAPQAEDALLRLAQLELARGDREGALLHLQRIPRDYPRSKSLARASYWTARVLFEKNDIPNACAANANALAQAGEAEIELRNQIQYQGQRCSSIAAAVVPPTNSPVTPPLTAAPAESQAATAKATVADTVSTTVPPPSPPSTKATAQDQRPKPPVQANDAKPSIVDPAKPPVNPVTKPPVTVSAGTSRPTGYSVQVAAYKTRAEADKLMASLTKRGYPARVDADAAYFRVRIGRYSTSKDAEDALKRIKAKQMDGFVVRAPEQ